MPKATCTRNINSKPPPYNIPCRNAFCQKVFDATQAHCQQENLPADTPVGPTYDPDYNGPGKGKLCYCCCSCFALNTPIEKTPGQFILIQDISDGSYIQATGYDLNWKQTRVLSQVAATIVLNQAMYLLKYKYGQEAEPREIMITVDHLFMMHGQKKLKAVQYLVPGDKLTASDGSAAEVVLVAPGMFNTAVHTIEMEGAVNGNLDNHLLNSNGVVSADYAVQMTYAVDELDAAHLVDTDDAHEVGTAEYNQAHCNRALQEFLDNPDAWPKGFYPVREPLINIPSTAMGFVTDAQSQNIWDNAEFNAFNNPVPRDLVLRLLRTNTMYNPDTIGILDWDNDVPNAYAFSQANQKFLVVTGGLARVKGMYLEAFTLIISAMQSYSDGAQCVGESDYNAVSSQMRKIWPDSLYAPIVTGAIPQIETLFGYIDPENAGGNPEDKCGDPGVECRIKTYWNALSFLGIPECAKPDPDFLRVTSASANSDLAEITVVYDNALDVPTATTKANYRFSPEVEVIEATMANDLDKRVVLSVTGLTPGSFYLLRVENVISDHDIPLKPGGDAVIVNTIA